MLRRTRLLLGSVLVLLACREAPNEAPGGDEQPGGATPPGFGPLAGLFASKLDEPGPYEAPRQSSDYADGAAFTGVIELGGNVGELTAMSWTGDATTPLHKLTRQLAEAANDANLTGLVIRADGLAIDMVHADELRRALLRFRAAGKSLSCHAERLGDASYHVFTACERVGLAPLGEIAVTGPAATPIHVKGLLDRVGVTADFLHVGAFKGAAEPITRESPSPEMLETLGAIVERRWASQLDAIAEGRKLSHEQAVAAVDRGLYVGDEAVAAKLADEVAPWTAFLATSTAGKPWKRLRAEAKLADFATLQRFLGMLPPERPSGAHVAVVYAVGNIVDGSGSGLIGAREEIASRTLVAALQAIADDDDVKAVVLRVDSGGGSALASEQIWHAAKALGERKPLVVSMGSAAASGGYYISAPAAKIYANADTMTGSIGVVGGKLVFGDALAKLGVNTFDVHRGERAMLWSTMRPWTAAERSTIEAMMRSTYDVFTARVAEGRKLAPAAVEAIAQGRVWTGADAKARGLVDELGTLHDAIAEAERRGGVTAGTALEVYPPEPTLRDILASFGQVQMMQSLAAAPAVASAIHALGAADPRLQWQLTRMVATLSALQSARIWAASPWVWPTMR